MLEVPSHYPDRSFVAELFHTMREGRQRLRPEAEYLLFLGLLYVSLVVWVHEKHSAPEFLLAIKEMVRVFPNAKFFESYFLFFSFAGIVDGAVRTIYGKFDKSRQRQFEYDLGEFFEKVATTLGPKIDRSF